MATKSDDPCRDKADEDEPIFTLRAQDEIAPELVVWWATLATRAGAPDDKVRGGRRGLDGHAQVAEGPPREGEDTGLRRTRR